MPDEEADDSLLRVKRKLGPLENEEGHAVAVEPLTRVPKRIRKAGGHGQNKKIVFDEAGEVSQPFQTITQSAMPTVSSISGCHGLIRSTRCTTSQITR